LHALNEGTLTDTNRKALLNWPGWGAFTPAFTAAPTPGWAHIADELDAVIPAKDLAVAQQYLDTSFFTPRPVIEAVYDLLRGAGFTGGRVLEPGCGSGRFMAVTPDDMDISWTGIDVDPTATRIAAALNPGAQFITGKLEETALPTDAFDAVIGNVPFSETHVFDDAYGGGPLHEYFIRRALDAVRPGGYVIVVTSRFTMDRARGVAPIIDVGGDAALIAAVRLPSGAFSAEGTDVVADILAFRKQADDSRYPGFNDAERNKPEFDPVWRQPKSTRPKVTDPAGDKPGHPVEVNRYWADYPDHVAGRMAVSTFFQNPLVVLSDDPRADIRRAVAAASAHIVPQTERAEFDPAAGYADVILEDGEGRKEGSFHLDGDTIVQIVDGEPQPVRNNKELRALIGLRDAANALLGLESDPHTSDATIQPVRDDALALYRAYVKAFGALNRGTRTEGKPDPETGDPTISWRRPPLGGFRADPDYVRVIALEEFDQDTGAAGPAPILLRRVNHAKKHVERVDTPAEALAVSRGEGRGVDLHRIAQLLGLATEQDAFTALGDLVYLDNGTPVPASVYLSGNIRRKLELARALADLDPSLQRNVTALETVMPADLGPLEIRVKLGAPWIPASDVNDFAREVIGGHAGAAYTPLAGLWEVSGTQGSYDGEQAYGTRKVSAMKVLEYTLNGRTLTVYDDVYDSDTKRWKKVRNNADTVAAQEKSQALDERFALWVWEDTDRTARLCVEYNRRFNSHVARTPDGSYLDFPGMADDITPWAHQKDGVDLVLNTDRAIVAHVMGAGKTKTMLMAGRKLKEFGLANKPLIVVPNHLLEQIAREAQQTFPTGRYLIAAKEDLAKDRRRLFAARCATGDWDAVVMTHSAFTSLPVAPEVEEQFIEREKWQLRQEILDSNRSARSKGPKAIAKRLRTLEARLGELRRGIIDSGQVLFEHLGIDHISIDEAHLFRRLPTNSTSRTNGFGSGSSKRAVDLLLKIETLAAARPGLPVTALYTGTLWSNTLAETWVWQRYTQPDVLEEAGVLAFDPYVATFIKYETSVEVAPDGSGFRLHERPVGVKNLPELKTMLRMNAHFVSAEKINLERPAHVENRHVSKPTEKQLEFMATLPERADDLRNGVKKTLENGKQDNMLVICNDGRRIALDPRLVGILDDSPKILDAAKVIAGYYHEGRGTVFGKSATPGTFQLVFLDAGTPKDGDAQSYGRLRAALVAHGVPSEKVRFVHEAKTDKARAALFASCRDGEVAVLVGSTPKVGMGTNIQTRLKHIHDIDAPWMPAEVAQRHGRALRPGNLNTEITIDQYVTEGTFDAFMWQALQRKQRSFVHLYSDDTTVREADDIGEVALSYGEVKALASGNPLLLEQATLAQQVQRLRLLRSVFLSDVNSYRSSAKKAEEQAISAARHAEVLEKAVEKVVDAVPTDFKPIIDKAAAGEVASYITVPYRGLSIGVAGSREKPSFDLRLSYQVLAETHVTKKMLRGNQEITAEFITDWADRVIDRMEGDAEHLRREAAEYRRRAEEYRTSAETLVFSHDAELTEKQRQLALVDAEIASDAETHAAAAAA
jgi:N12 class adenine-specific DNA methylase/SAM-dependent methyltransferase